MEVKPDAARVSALMTSLAELEARVADIHKERRRQHYPQNLAECVEWEREFRAESGRADPRSRVELCKIYARRFGLPYVTVKAALADAWGSQ